MPSNDFSKPFADQDGVVPTNSLITRRAVLGGGAMAGIALLVGRGNGASAATKKKTTTKRSPPRAQSPPRR